MILAAIQQIAMTSTRALALISVANVSLDIIQSKSKAGI